MFVVTIELTQLLESRGILGGDIVIDPHPPAWVQPRNGCSQLREELLESVGGGRGGVTQVLQVCASGYVWCVVCVGEHSLSTT